VVAVAAGSLHSLAVTADGRVWAWGANTFGQLGLGHDTAGKGVGATLVPTLVPGISDVVAVSASSSFTVSLRRDGTVWAWGENFLNQLGDGAGAWRNTPGPVPGLTRIRAIDAGGDFTLALRADGTVWAWGDNANGQLGLGHREATTEVVQVPGLEGVRAIAAHWLALAMTTDQTVWVWGEAEPSPAPVGPPGPRSGPARKIMLRVSWVDCNATLSEIQQDGYICYETPKREPFPEYGALFVNASRVRVDVDPIDVDGVRYLELRPLAEAAGGKVTWDGATQSINVALPGRTLALRVGERTVTVNGRPLDLEGPVRTVNGFTVVPASFFTRGMGLLVHVYPRSRATAMTLPGADWRRGTVERAFAW
jgi:hypothetical protein